MKQHVYTYLKSSRRVGHTTLLKSGAKHYDKPFFVVGGDMNQARQLLKEVGNENGIPVSMKQPNKMLNMYGDSIPVLIDNYAFMRSCEDYEDSLRDERQRCSELNREHHREVVGMREDYKRYRLEDTKQMLRLNDKLSETKKKLSYNEDIVQGMYDIDNYIITDFEKMSLWDRVFNYKKFCKEKYK
jgi:hypothetical protein